MNRFWIVLHLHTSMISVWFHVQSFQVLRILPISLAFSSEVAGKYRLPGCFEHVVSKTLTQRRRPVSTRCRPQHNVKWTYFLMSHACLRFWKAPQSPVIYSIRYSLYRQFQLSVHYVVWVRCNYMQMQRPNTWHYIRAESPETQRTKARNAHQPEAREILGLVVRLRRKAFENMPQKPLLRNLVHDLTPYNYDNYVPSHSHTDYGSFTLHQGPQGHQGPSECDGPDPPCWKGPEGLPPPNGPNITYGPRWNQAAGGSLETAYKADQVTSKPRLLNRNALFFERDVYIYIYISVCGFFWNHLRFCDLSFGLPCKFVGLKSRDMSDWM